MALSPGQAAIEAVLRPLEFAARDEFAQLPRVRDLEASVESAARRALDCALPRDLATVLRAVQETFAKPLEGEARRIAIEGALRSLRPFSGTDYAERALAASPAVLPGVGARRAESLAKRGLRSVSDLLFYLPVRYDDRRALRTVRELEVGGRATFIAQVQGCGFGAWRGRASGRAGRMFEAVVGDWTDSVTLKWFRGGESIARTVRQGVRLLVTGEVKRYRFSKELQHPEVEVLESEDE